MQVGNDIVVLFHYTLKNDQGDMLDSSADQTPLAYLHGHGNIISGLEVELEGKEVGDHFKVTLSPEKAYGIHNPSLVQTVARSAIQDVEEVLVGMRFQLETGEGPVVVTVTDIAGDQITLDGNHPLAGETLHFEIDIVGIREATQEELAHGHVHQPGEHHR
ncbi:MAG: peptidylprolyl isomerase [Anaerolineales bacterium]|nr:peptidylprolyl isomerase [Anaerolineales bacterium]